MLRTVGHPPAAFAEALAKSWEMPLEKIQAAVNYIQAFPEEIGEQVADYDAIDFAALKRMLPNIREFVVPAE